MTLPDIPNFASLFQFDQRVSALETKMSEFKQTSQFADAVSSIPSIVDNYLASKMKEAVDVVVQLQTNKFREEAQAENQEFLNQVDSTMKAIIKEQVQAQVSKIMPKIEKYVTESLGAKVLNERGHQVIPWDYFINNDLEYLKGGSSSRKHTTSITKKKATDYGQVKWIEDKDLKGQKFYGYDSNMETSKDVYSRHKIIAVTSLKIMKYFGYNHQEDIIVRRQDYQLYNFREGDFKRLRQDIKDMLLLLVQKRVEDLQLGVESYQKKINLRCPNTYCSDLTRMTPYTAYPDIQGIIYEEEMNKNRLMRTDELHKFSDGTLNHVRIALNDIAIGIKMDYLPKRK
nr:hypothetical protein [Tanacetum cinerariifolium]